MVNIDLNKPWIISNSGQLSDLDHLPTKTEYIKYLQITDTHTSGPLHNTIVELNKSKVIINGGELSDLEYLPSITEYMKYLQNVDM